MVWGHGKEYLYEHSFHDFCTYINTFMLGTCQGVDLLVIGIDFYVWCGVGIKINYFPCGYTIDSRVSEENIFYPIYFRLTLP